MPTHFIGRHDDKTGCCKICAASAHRGAKNKHVNVCCDSQEELKNDPQFLTKVVTGDGSWCYGYDSVSKQQSSQQKSPNLAGPKKLGTFAQVSRQC